MYDLNEMIMRTVKRIYSRYNIQFEPNSDIYARILIAFDGAGSFKGTFYIPNIFFQSLNIHAKI